jgi:hypothetical protein
VNSMTKKFPHDKALFESQSVRTAQHTVLSQDKDTVSVKSLNFVMLIRVSVYVWSVECRLHYFCGFDDCLLSSVCVCMFSCVCVCVLVRRNDECVMW